MAAPATKKFGKFLVYLDLAGTGTFVAPCGFTSKSLTFSADMNEQVIPDCDDPDAAAWVGREKKSHSWSISGEGLLAMAALDTWRQFAVKTDPTPVKIKIVGTETGAGYWVGNAFCSSFELSAELGDKLKVSVQIDSDGEPVWTADTTGA